MDYPSDRSIGSQMTILMDTYRHSAYTNDNHLLAPLALSSEWHNSSHKFNETVLETEFIQNNTSFTNISLSESFMPDIINITELTPLEYAMVMYGYIMPFLLLLTLVANTLIVLVLAQKHMRTPTNLVLLSMAVADMLTLVFPSPWYFYMYTLGYHSHILYPPALCYTYNTMTDILPIAFHTASIWLTILLAGQRFLSFVSNILFPYYPKNNSFTFFLCFLTNG